MTPSDIAAHDAEQQRQRILSMEPGPELDAEVAEKIFSLMPCDGWVRMNFGSAGGPALAKRCDHAPETCYSTRTIGSIQGRIGGARPYSSDPGAAMAVLERLTVTRWRAHLRVAPPPAPSSIRIFDGLRLAAEQHVVGFQALPLAVARAALLAMLAAPDARP